MPFFALDCQYWEGVSIKRWERRVGGLDLPRNNLEGELPTDALVKLISLDTLILPGNDVFGTLSGLGQLTALTDLDLAENRFTGEIPSELGEVNQLTRVDLSNNELEGQLPASLQNLSQLRVLQLRRTRYRVIPEEYATLTQLEDLDLAENDLSVVRGHNTSQIDIIGLLKELSRCAILPETSYWISATVCRGPSRMISARGIRR